MGVDHGMTMAMLLRLGGMIGMQPLSLRSNGMEFYVVSRDAEKKCPQSCDRIRKRASDLPAFGPLVMIMS